MKSVDLKIEECAKELAMDSAHIPAIKSVITPYFMAIKKLLRDSAYAAGYNTGKFGKRAKSKISTVSPMDVYLASERFASVWKQSSGLVEANCSIHDFQI